MSRVAGFAMQGYQKSSTTWCLTGSLGSTGTNTTATASQMTGLKPSARSPGLKEAWYTCIHIHIYITKYIHICTCISLWPRLGSQVVMAVSGGSGVRSCWCPHGRFVFWEQPDRRLELIFGMGQSYTFSVSGQALTRKFSLFNSTLNVIASSSKLQSILSEQQP